jgi:hypothetical protein
MTRKPFQRLKHGVRMARRQDMHRRRYQMKLAILTLAGLVGKYL